MRLRTVFLFSVDWRIVGSILIITIAVILSLVNKRHKTPIQNKTKEIVITKRVSKTPDNLGEIYHNHMDYVFKNRHTISNSDIITSFFIYTNIPHSNGLVMIDYTIWKGNKYQLEYEHEWMYMVTIKLNNHYLITWSNSIREDVYSPSITGKPMDWKFRDASAVTRRAEKLIGQWRK